MYPNGNPPPGESHAVAAVPVAIPPSLRGRWLFLLGLGSVLVAIRMDANLAGLPLGELVPFLGVALAGAACLALRAAGSGRGRTAMPAALALAVLWCVVEGFAAGRRPASLAGWLSGVSSFFLPVAAFLVAWALGRTCREPGWPAAQHAWRQASVAVLLCVALPLEVSIGVAALAVALGSSFEFKSHNFLLLAGTWLVLTFPALLVVRGAALTAQAIASAEARPASRPALWFARPRGLALVWVVLLVPVWLLAPSAVHYAVTPAFDHPQQDPSVEWRNLVTSTAAPLKKQLGIAKVRSL